MAWLLFVGRDLEIQLSSIIDECLGKNTKIMIKIQDFPIPIEDLFCLINVFLITLFAVTMQRSSFICIFGARKHNVNSQADCHSPVLRYLLSLHYSASSNTSQHILVYRQNTTLGT
jgi:hypothetical protein